MRLLRFVTITCAAISALPFRTDAAETAVPKTLTPGENVVDGIPPVPAELVEQVGRYTERARRHLWTGTRHGPR